LTNITTLLTSAQQNNPPDPEKSFSILKDIATGSLSPTTVATGLAGQTAPISVTSADPSKTVTGAVHSHPNGYYVAPSSGDLYALATANNANSDFINFYVIGSMGSVYVLTVSDPAKLTTFLTTYPMSTNFNTTLGEFSFSSPLKADFDLAYQSLYNSGTGLSDNLSFIYAIAYVLSKNNTGIEMLRKDSSGTFKEINTVIATPTAGVTTFNPIECP
jgi:hypothetical protein